MYREDRRNPRNYSVLELVVGQFLQIDNSLGDKNWLIMPSGQNYIIVTDL